MMLYPSGLVDDRNRIHVACRRFPALVAFDVTVVLRDHLLR